MFHTHIYSEPPKSASVLNAGFAGGFAAPVPFAPDFPLLAVPGGGEGR